MTMIETAEPLVDPGQTYQRDAATVEAVDPDAGLIEVKIVPYEREADLGGGLHEVFTAGAFSAAVGNPKRCKVTDQQHNRAVVVGEAVELRDEGDGLYGKIKISDTRAGRDVLTLLRDGVLEELSVEFRPMVRKHEIVRRAPDDILVRHHKAELVGVSPVGAGAYGSDARVLALRAAHLELARERALAELGALTSGRRMG